MVKWLCWDLSVQSYYLLMILLADSVATIGWRHIRLMTPLAIPESKVAQQPVGNQIVKDSEIPLLPAEGVIVIIQSVIAIFFVILTAIALFLFITRNFALRGFPEYYVKQYAYMTYLFGLLKIAIMILAVLNTDAPSWAMVFGMALVQFLILIPFRIWTQRGAEAVIKHNMGTTEDGNLAAVNLT